MLEGDQVELDVSVESDASLVLSNPTALRIHKMNTGKAIWKQTFSISNGGFLETHPEWIIPQAHSRFEQRTRIDIQTEGKLLFIEAFAPGRVAFEESFKFDSFRNRLELYYEHKLVALEQSNIEPAVGSHSGWRASFKNPYLYSLYVSASELLDNDGFFDFIYKQQSPTLLCGSSKLDHGPCWNIKLLSESSVEAKAALMLIREEFYRTIGRPVVDLRK